VYSISSALQNLSEKSRCAASLRILRLDEPVAHLDTAAERRPQRMSAGVLRRTA
jgi:hypothetical protein